MQQQQQQYTTATTTRTHTLTSHTHLDMQGVVNVSRCGGVDGKHALRTEVTAGSNVLLRDAPVCTYQSITSTSTHIKHAHKVTTRATQQHEPGKTNYGHPTSPRPISQ